MQKVFINPSKLKSASIKIPGSKSYTNRALVIAALAEGNSILKNPLFSDDTKYTIKALKKLGINIKEEKGNLIVEGQAGKFKDPKEALYLGNAGTGMRFLTAILGLCEFKSKITGNERMKQRPIKDLITALRGLGVKIESTNKNGCPPLKIKGGKMKGGKVEIAGNVSSQYLSALLIVSPYSESDVEIIINGELVSKPYVDMTVQIMRDFNVEVANNNYKSFKIKSGQKYKGIKYLIEGDASSASYFYALEVLHNTDLKIKNIRDDSLQSDLQIRDVINKMKGPDGSLKGLGGIDLNHMPDAAMTVAILCAFAKGKSKLINIANLRVKETDRIKALVTELNKVGCDAKELDDGIEINGDPSKLHGDVLIETYDDHRIAMCFAVLASKIKGLQILDPDCTSKTYPNFFEDLAKTGIKLKKVEFPNIVLTGMRASGKTAVGKIIAKKTRMRFVDCDEEIERQEKMSIPEIVKKHNWFYFRKKEKYVVRKISKMKNAVIATGGGVIIDKENEKALKKNGKIVFLSYDLSILKKRLTKKLGPRPKLTNKKNIKDELQDVWDKRKNRYTGSADIVFKGSDKMTIEEKAEQIIMLI